MSDLEEVIAAWTAEVVTLESDAIAGVSRKAEVENCAVRAYVAARRIDPHPLDPFLASERERCLAAYRPGEGQWWTNPADVEDGREAAAVVYGLQLVRKGLRPLIAAQIAAKRDPELPAHRLDAIPLRVYHLCRLADLPVI